MKKVFLTVLVALSLIFIPNVKADEDLPVITDHEKVTIYLFRSNGCGHCQDFVDYFARNYYQYQDYFEIVTYEVSDVEKQKISDEVFKEFKSEVIVENSLKKNNLDRFVGIISFIFDINFNVSLEILERKQYIKKMLDRFNFSDGDTKAKIDMIEQLAERYIENRLKG